MVFMTATAFSLWNSDNFIPLAPFGAAGVLKGAVAAFFGFLGFDEVCVCCVCMCVCLCVCARARFVPLGFLRFRRCFFVLFCR